MKFFKENQLLIVCLLGLVTRLYFLPISQTVDADAVSRIFISKGWSVSFNWITEGTWLPLHFYFTGISILLTSDQVLGPKLLHILFAVLTAIPLYSFTKREFEPRGALFVVFIWLFNPLVFRNSFHALAGMGYIFFIAITINELSKALKHGKLINVVYAGLSVTIAAGFRYEAWLLIPVFLIILLIYQKWKYAIVFILFAFLFPAFWMYCNYNAHGELLYNIASQADEQVVLYNANINLADKWGRLSFYSLSYLFILSPLIILPIIYNLFKKSTTLKQWVWFAPFIIMLCVLSYKAYSGTLFKQHRFTLSLILFSLPVFSLWFTKSKGRYIKIILVLLTCILYIPCSFAYKSISFHNYFTYSPLLHEIALGYEKTLSEMDGIPMIHNKEIIELSRLVAVNTSKKNGLLLEFIGWTDTYFVGLNSNLESSQIYFFPSEKYENIDFSGLDYLLQHQSEGVIVCKKKNSTFNGLWNNEKTQIQISENIQLNVQELYQTKNYILYKYNF